MIVRMSLGADLVGEGRLERRGQDLQPGRRVRGEEVLHEPGVEAVDRADGVDDRVLRRQLEHDGDVAELEVGVDQHDRLVGAHGRATTARLVATTDLPAPPLVEKTVMTRPTLAVVVVGRRRRAADARRMRPDRLGDAAARPPELDGVDRCGEHVLDAGADGPLEELGGELVGDQDRPDARGAAGAAPRRRVERPGPRARRAEHDDHGVADRGRSAKSSTCS